MRKIEYKQVTVPLKRTIFWDEADFEKRLQEVLSQMGDEGWELKSSLVFGINGMKLIFGREAEDTR